MGKNYINLNDVLDISFSGLTLESLNDKVSETLSEIENKIKCRAGSLANIKSIKSILGKMIQTQKDSVTLCYRSPWRQSVWNVYRWNQSEYRIDVSKVQCAYRLLSYLFKYLNLKPTELTVCNRFLKYFSINGHSTFKLSGVMSVGLLGINVFTTLLNILEDGIRYLLTTLQQASYVLDDDRKQAMIWDMGAQIFIVDAPIVLLSSLYFFYGLFDFTQQSAKTHAWLDHLMEVLQKECANASEQSRDLAKEYNRWIACKLFQLAIDLSPEVSEQFIKRLQSCCANSKDSVSIRIDENHDSESETMPLLPNTLSK
jgi:hypothetical protein